MNIKIPRRIAVAIFASLGLTACAGLQPNAVQNGYPSAKLHPLDKKSCTSAKPGEDCTRLSELYNDRAVSGLADDGFLAAQSQQAYKVDQD